MTLAIFVIASAAWSLCGNTPSLVSVFTTEEALQIKVGSQSRSLINDVAIDRGSGNYVAVSQNIGVTHGIIGQAGNIVTDAQHPFGRPVWINSGDRWLVHCTYSAEACFGPFKIYDTSGAHVDDLPGEYWLDSFVLPIADDLLVVPSLGRQPLRMRLNNENHYRVIDEIPTSNECSHAISVRGRAGDYVVLFDKHGHSQETWLLKDGECQRGDGLSLSMQIEQLQYWNSAMASCDRIICLDDHCGILSVYSKWDNDTQQRQTFIMMHEVPVNVSLKRMVSPLRWAKKLNTSLFDHDSVDVSDDGGLIAIACHDGVRVLSAQSGTVEFSYASDHVGAVGFARMATNESVRLMVADGNQIRYLRYP